MRSTRKISVATMNPRKSRRRTNPALRPMKIHALRVRPSAARDAAVSGRIAR